ncbi:hypothetical protein GHT06_003780 [Daphnia sinensis]|uniref:DNA (cytosine-5-)-methyltransferase n=1 Tax=Daphnia sinensis TaxID=1820382 RepID=A0AAD5KDP8_9CRUS|nr:hypothetical protein GHT06_003780 [Daphnia sinensis]
MTLHLIDLFCGAGGISEGARLAGANVAVVVDSWADALAIHERRHPKALHFNENIGDVPAAEYGKLLRTRVEPFMKPGDLLHVHASPPCQAVSIGNTQNRDVESARELMFYTLDVIAAVGPTSWSIEQVNHPVVRQMFEERGVEYWTVRMRDYGVKQLRTRLFAGSGWRLEDVPTQPLPGLGAVRDLPPDTHYISDRFHQVYIFDYKLGLRTPRLVVADDAPLYTVTSKPYYFYDKEGFFIEQASVQFLESVQTFPQGYITQMPISTVKMMHLIGNAVPPTFAHALIGTIVKLGGPKAVRARRNTK